MTSPLEGSPNYSRGHPGHSCATRSPRISRCQRASGLWDDDAFIRDRETGVYVDKTKLRRLDLGPLLPHRRTAEYSRSNRDSRSFSGRRFPTQNPACWQACRCRLHQCGPIERRRRSTDNLRIADCAWSVGRGGRHLSGIGPIVGATQKSRPNIRRSTVPLPSRRRSTRSLLRSS